MIDFFKLKSGVKISVQAAKNSDTRIIWKPKPPYTPEQRKEIQEIAWPRILKFVVQFHGSPNHKDGSRAVPGGAP